MSENPLQQLNRMGQSVWYDNIRRGLLDSGELERMVQAGEIRGVTSNPAIFENAIAKTDEYTSVLKKLAGRGHTPEAAYAIISAEDIQRTADILRPVYEQSRSQDGFVSLEVSPSLAKDSDGSLVDAKRLWKDVARPNLMIKIPGTLAGLDAVREGIAEGINVNVTLLFSTERYRRVMDAYLSGLEDRLARGLPLDSVASVASFFVSRVDTLIDQRLDRISAAGNRDSKRAQTLRGHAAIANTRLAYQAFQAIFQSGRFQHLARNGAKIQRPLWASTSTKDPAYADTIYVEALVARMSVNTMPPATVAAYRDHGKPVYRIEENLEEARELPANLLALGISLEEATAQLEEEGVKAFQRSFESMLKSIADRMQHSTQ
jgi:transaldolase